MIFSSLVFLFMFLPITLGIYYLVGNRFKNYVLLITSLIFYAWGEPIYVFLMIISIIFNYIFGIGVSTKNRKSVRKIWLIIAIIFNIGLLFIFKYTGFILYNVDKVIKIGITIPNIALPLGISFFTFQSVSYVIDVYREDVPVQKKLTNIALYISLFPQLVAGPIVRYQTVNEQISSRNHSIKKFGTGVNRFIVGLAKKVLISNPLGFMADQIFGTTLLSLSTTTAWLGIIAYGLQVYFDFSGYSDMAIGLGKMFGFDFLENFNYPYISQSASEFWRRWHISLGSWFKDYVYIPLGGSRNGILRTYLNLFAVWFLTGFWHGASWTFIAWGLYYGIIISIEKSFLENILNNILKPIRHIYLLTIVAIGWVFFRSESFSYAFNYIKSMFGMPQSGIIYSETSLGYINDYGYLIIISIILATPMFKKIIKHIRSKNINILENGIIYFVEGSCICAILLVITLQLVNSTYNPFLYFRF